MSAAPMCMLLAIGLDMGQWALARAELQRIADTAALAGMMRYAATGTSTPTLCASATNKQACAGASAAADLAEINGASKGTRAWNDKAATLTDGSVTVAFVSGVKNASDAAMRVTASRPIAAALGFAVHGGQSYTITATATAELVSGASTGPQPCIMALGGYGTGVTTNIDVSVSGNANVTMNGCSMRSNEGISLSGNVNVVAQAVYSNASVSQSGNAHLTANNGIYTNAGQIADPYANNTAIQNAFSSLTTQTSNKFQGGGSASPGIYSSMSITSNTTLAPGLYVVTGSFSVSGNAAVNGTGVTIVTGGAFSLSGGTNFNVTAPGTSPTGGGISGILVASNGTQGTSISGNASEAVSGVFYLPNAQATFSGNGATNGVNTCLEVIAATVVLSGNSNLGGNCSALGAASFGSVPPTSTVQLVQ
jgi:Flp pilus assembly protein TadG